MINIKDIKGYSALNILETYSGINPYLIKMRKEYLKNRKIRLTETQIKYIIDNHKREPILVNKLIKITPFFGEELQRQEELKFIPEKILFEFILAENDKTYHVYGKVKRNQKESKMYFIPKTQVLTDPYFEEIDIDVDFTKYNDVLSQYGKKLYSHQEEGIKFLLTRNGCILADDMGLGKSMQSIIAALESKAERILILCPASAKINWKREIKVFCDNVTIVDGTRWSKAKFTIINYDILKNFHTVSKKGDDVTVEYNRHMVNANFDLVIIDEAHNLKNKNSKRGEIMSDLILNYDIKKIWLLTGTPVANRPMDFYNLLKLIRAKIAENWKYYAQRYCDAKRIFTTLKNGKKKKVWLTNGSSNLDELASKTKNILLRRLKTEVLDMPDKLVIPVYHELDERGWIEYEKLWEDYLIERKELKKRGPIQRELVELILLRKFIAMQAIPNTIEMVEEALELDKKVIIFTNFTDELNELSEYFGKKCVTHYGEMNSREKQNSVDEFQNNPSVKVFIGNIRSAGVAITLTRANFVIFNSFEWVPGYNEQAEDRAYRIGQNKDVIVKYQLFVDTISTRMWETLRNKKDIIAVIMGDKQAEAEAIEIMTDNLLKEEND